jgi:hypothetical protein
MTLWSNALAAIDGVFADRLIAYTGAGLDGTGDPIAAIYSQVDADPFQGPGSTARKVTYEVAKALLPGEPRKGNSFVDGGDHWRVIDKKSLDDIDRWLLTVEKAS